MSKNEFQDCKRSMKTASTEECFAPISALLLKLSASSAKHSPPVSVVSGPFGQKIEVSQICVTSDMYMHLLIEVSL